MKNLFLFFLFVTIITSCDDKKQDRVIYEQQVPSYSYVICPTCAGYGQLSSYYGPVVCPDCQGAGQVAVSSGGSNISFGSRSTSVVQTNASCDACSCSGYKGIKHDAGTYEGDCSHSDGWGHSCGHSPSHHGLRQY